MGGGQYFVFEEMAPVWPILLTSTLGIFAIGILYVLRKWRNHFVLTEFKIMSFKKLRFASSFQDLWKTISPQSATFFSGSFIIEIVGFRFKVSKLLKFTFHTDTINVYINSNLFKSSKESSRKRKQKSPSSALFILKYLIKIIKLTCQDISIITTVGYTSEAETIIVEQLKLENLSICKDLLNIISIDSIKLEQFIIGCDSIEDELILKTDIIKINRDISLSQFDILISDSLALNINVRFLYFVSSFIKASTDCCNQEIETLDSESFFLPWPILFNFYVHDIDLKLILPETDPSVKYFKWLQFKFTKFTAKCFTSSKSLPKITCLLDKFEMITKIEDQQKIGLKHFCPVDILLKRGPEQVAGQTKDLIILQNVFLCNWTTNDNFQSKTLPEAFIVSWIHSILKNAPICSIKSEMVDLSSMDLDMTSFENMQRDFIKFTYDYFKHSKLTSDRNIFGVLDQFDFNVPFEFPMSSLIDHSVVLFKAGWRPLSKKTERGYWAGDGDKFLRSDWALNLQAKRVRARIEDDGFESKLSAISHFQRQLAESRCRLEPVLLSESYSNSLDNPVGDSYLMQNLANILSISTDKVEPGQSIAIIELHKALFKEYRGLISKSHLLTNWSLIDLAVDNFKLSLSWSSRYLGKKGSLSSLLNHIENGNQISADTIESLSTFLGGFIDISGTTVQINLRNYSRPVLIAPDLRITGPVFLVEDGVKDPDVLIKFPVRVLPENSRSSFAELPINGTVDVLRSILPLKIYHCVFASITRPELVQASVSPYWLGCLALLDRVIDRFVKSSTEDPSPSLPGWDKLRYNVRGCHSRLTIASPCIISRITDSDPISCTEILNLSFPRGLDIGIIPGGKFVLKCPQTTLSVDSQYLYTMRCALESSGPLRLWDLGIKQTELTSLKSKKSFSESSLDFSQNTLIPIIKLSQTELELKFCIKNVYNNDPCHHWSVRPVARSSCSKQTDWVLFGFTKTILVINLYYYYFRNITIRLKNSGVNRLLWN